ncbi:DUF2624 domain-containing protein [Oceanobacillus luteolus]|uniref:DUF2624 domain-containing protein n=1 Tax=Oceanobacillus luteolus TaxID=1274358 RepID=A0ABW4HWC9_9BACI|nr:DUF2624 domain-containing protein [Oceanobacillus luteolus]MCM3738721.1 DUF2624 domain-containing protein [Oceanobacillus luteolus]
MSFFIKEIVKNRLRQLTVNELLHYAGEYGFSITREEAHHILHYLQSSDLDIFSKQAMDEAYVKLAEITDQQTASKAKLLFEQIVKSYGLEDYFK